MADNAIHLMRLEAEGVRRETIRTFEAAESVAENLQHAGEIRDAMQSGYDVIGKLAKRPDEDTLEELLRDSPFSAGLPPPRHAQRALPAHADSVDEDEDAKPRARRSTRRGRRS